MTVQDTDIGGDAPTRRRMGGWAPWALAGAPARGPGTVSDLTIAALALALAALLGLIGAPPTQAAEAGAAPFHSAGAAR